MENINTTSIHFPHPLEWPNYGNVMNSSLLVFFLSISSLFFILRAGNGHKKYRLPPTAGPTPWPIVGILPNIFLKKPHFRWLLSITEGKEISSMRVGGVYSIFVNSAEIAREFLKKQDAAFASRPVTMATEYSSRGFRTVVVSPWGDQWKKMRRVLATEVLSAARIRQQEKIRLEEADHIINYIYHQCKQQSVGGTPKAVVDVRHTARHYSGNFARRMLLGSRYVGGEKRLGMPVEEETEYVEAAFTMLSLIYAFSPADFVPILRWFDLDGDEKIAKKCIEVFDRHHDPIIDQRVKKWRSEGVPPSGKEAEDAVDILLSLKDSDGKPILTVEEVKGQITELVLATGDNTPTMVEWALAHLLDQPELMKKAVEELDRVVGKDRWVQESDFPNLPYIKACCREAIRIHPVAAFNLPHVALHDTEVAGYFIPKGSELRLSRIGLGRNPNIWPDPLRYNPDRHLEAGSVEIAEPDLRFISFTTGRRGCMGNVVGQLMTYMLLARLLQAFEWSMAPGETYVDLSEEQMSLFKAKSLRACATPRLPKLLEELKD